MFSQDDLPYDFNALEPFIDAHIMELHYQKHHATYVKNLNNLLQQLEEAKTSGNLGAQIALQSGIQFNGGGHINHSIFWTNLCPASQAKPLTQSPLLESIQATFGSFETFQTRMSQMAIAIQGSGWAWLAFSQTDHSLKIVTCANQDPVSNLGLTPLLGIDVWEHAYYLQYKNARPEYVKNIWNVVNWENVSQRFEKASQEASCMA